MIDQTQGMVERISDETYFSTINPGSYIDDLSDDEYYQLRAYEEELAGQNLMGVISEQGECLKGWQLVSFVSKSKGRSRGQGRPRSSFPIKRKHWIEVELAGRPGCRFYLIREDHFKGSDDIATEVLGSSVDPQEAERTFMARLRQSTQLKIKFRNLRRISNCL